MRARSLSHGSDDKERRTFQWNAVHLQHLRDKAGTTQVAASHRGRRLGPLGLQVLSWNCKQVATYLTVYLPHQEADNWSRWRLWNLGQR